MNAKERKEIEQKFIEEIKKRTSIWKKEHYEEEDSRWLKGNPVIGQNQLK